MLRRQQRRRWWTLAATITICFAVGALAAWILRPDPLLPQELLQKTSVVKQDSVQEQFYLALEENRPSAYRAVAQYFPPSASPLNEHYARMAQRYLADYYRENGRLDQAMREYAKLAELGEQSPVFTVIGLFGQSVVAELQQKSVEATSKLTLATRWWSKVPEDQRQPLLGMLPPKLRTTFLELLQGRSTPEGGSPEPTKLPRSL